MTEAGKKNKGALSKFAYCLEISLGIILLLGGSVLGQDNSRFSGTVVDEKNEPLPGAFISEMYSHQTVMSDKDGKFSMKVPSEGHVRLITTFIGFLNDTTSVEINPLSNRFLEIKLVPKSQILGEVVVESRFDRADALQQIDLRSLSHIPLPSGNFESLLSTLGASSRNEMSSQYSVRGGNFDENLVYVNDIEIYRPLTVKSGQQEGLSFLNPDMVSSVQFAAGGFDARYGDKMSSVLDIRYKRPDHYAGSISASLLGGSAHLEGRSASHKFTHITGIRYKSNQYLLNTLQTKGDYKPRFLDLQTFLTYDVSRQLEISFLGNLASNSYKVIPRSRETSFGTYQQALNFTVFYEGREIDRFANMLGALTLNYRPSDNVSLKFIGSGFMTSEDVTYDILGQYRIDLLDNTIGSETAGDSILNLGVGGMLSHARNYLDGRVLSISHKGNYHSGDENLYWGITLQSENFNNRIREWEMIDSAGYSVPFSDEKLLMNSSVIGKNKLKSVRFTAYIQNTSIHNTGFAALYFNYGGRMNYWTGNGQLVVSPRVAFTLVPERQKKFSFHISAGWYHQPPFFKEMIGPGGEMNTHIKAQKSVHYVIGSAYDFQMWKRPFRFSAELYYKKLDNLIPYVLDDVDIQYLPKYTAKGFATGIEFKLNGEFVKNAESWATLSFLRTREDRYFDAYGSYPRPTDQLVNFGLFFQDYLPSNPSYRFYTTLYFGSRLPFGSPDYEKPQEYYYLTSYKRIDIGVSKSIVNDRDGNRRMAQNFIRDAWFSLELFNLFGFNNQASYQWIRTVSNQEGLPNMFAVPNYLTGRLFNIRFTASF